MKIDFNPNDADYVERIENRLSYTTFVEEFDTPMPDDTVIWGTYSRTWRNKKKREVLHRYTDIVNGRKDSITAHARDYLVSTYNACRCSKVQRACLNTFQMPLYADPCILEDACYVDISSAYFSIMCHTGWDCDFSPGRFFGRGQPPDDFPLQDNKVARSSLVSLAKSRTLMVWKQGEFINQKMWNPVDNPHIFAVIAATLNAIAGVAVDVFGCVYVATDGFIVPYDQTESFRDFIDSWGLRSKIKNAGLAFVGGVGAYWIGEKKSQRPMCMHAVDKIRRDIDLTWLHKRVPKT